MKRVIASHRVLGPPGARRPSPLQLSDPSVSHESWHVDTAHSGVAALWLDGVLWLAADAVHGIASGVAAALSPGDEAPPVMAPSSRSRWVKVTPEIGSRYVAIAGAARDPEPSTDSREALLDAVLDLPPPPKPGVFGKLFSRSGKNRAGLSVEAAALVLDVVADSPPHDLTSWLAALHEREVDLSWAGNEGGPGLVHAFRGPMLAESSVRAALLDHAREDAALTRIVRESAEVWLESSGEQGVEAGRLVADDPTRGWVEDLELDAIASDIRGSAGAWLDPGTGNARSVWRCVVSGAAILEALRTHVEQPTIVAVHSAPEDSVVCVHLIGGIDRASGDLVGFALQRVWT